MLLLFHPNTRTNDRMSGEFVFVRYVEITSTIDSVDLCLNCPCLGWATDDETDHSVTQSLSGAGVTEAGDWYCVVSFRSIISLHVIVRSNYSISIFTPELQ